ncbi:MAG: phage major capsid protein [Pseudomonadota bacterium]
MPTDEILTTDPTSEVGSNPVEVKAAMTEFLGAFEAFKEANDERLSALEAKRSEDVVLGEKVERINNALTEQKASIDRLALGARRPALGPTAAPVDETKQAFLDYVRTGDTARLDTKSLNAGTPSEGGYFAPEQVAIAVTNAVTAASPMRQIATVREISGNTYRKPTSSNGLVANWVGETASRPETATSTLTAIDFPTADLYAMPAATQALLDDAVIDIEQWLAEDVQGEFADQETAAFVSGNGSNKPTGFLHPTKAPEASRGSTEIGYIATGVDGGFPSTDPADVLLDLIYTPKQSYRANGRFVMDKGTVAAIRKFKDKDDNYIWQPAIEAGREASLLGYPLTEIEEMPDIGSDSFSIAFGDFRRGYLIVDRQGIQVLRDPYSAKPYVLFYTTKRVGGGVQDFDAIKLLKFGTA